MHSYKAIPIILIPALVVHIGNRHKIDHSFMISCKSTVVPMYNIYNQQLGKAMTPQSHMATALTKQTNNERMEGFLFAYIT